MPDRHSEENRKRDITVGMLPTGIPAPNIADGSVSNAEFQSLNNAPPNIALALDQRQPIHQILTGISNLVDDGSMVLSGGLPVTFPLEFTGAPPGSPVNGQLALSNGQQQLTVYSVLQSAWVGAPGEQTIGRLAGPFPGSGFWYPDYGIGLSTSAEAVADFDQAGATPMLRPKQRLTEWTLSVEHGPGSDIPHEIYYKPVGGVWTASGIVITLEAGETQVIHTEDLILEQGDLVLPVCTDPSGYTPGATVFKVLVQPIVET